MKCASMIKTDTLEIVSRLIFVIFDCGEILVSTMTRSSFPSVGNNNEDVFVSPTSVSAPDFRRCRKT